MLTDRQILEVRSHFPLLREKTWLYNCSQGALWGAVDGTLKDYSQSWRRAMDPWRDWVGAYEALRAGFARFIGAKPDEIAVVTSASAGINPIANAIEDRGLFSRVPGFPDDLMDAARVSARCHVIKCGQWSVT